jgi:hypothetical protein
VNSWIKRVIGAAVLGGGLLVLGSGAASAEPASAEVSAGAGDGRIGVRVCGGGTVLSGLLGRCGGQGGSDSDGSSAGAQAGDRSAGVRGRVAGLASAEVAAARRSSRPRAALSARLDLTPRNRVAEAEAAAVADSSPDAQGDARAALAGRLERLLDLRLRRLESRLAGIGLLQSGSFDLADDLASTVASLTPASDTPPASDDTPPPRSGVLPTVGGLAEAVGTLTPALAVLPGLVDLLPAPDAPAVEPPEPSEQVPGVAGIGVVESGELASGNQAEADAGPVSASAPVNVCGNSVGAFGDASASCGGSQAGSGGQSAGGSAGSTSTGSAGAAAGTGSGNLARVSVAGVSAFTPFASGNQAEADAGPVSASAPVNVCGNGVGLLGGASASCDEDTGGATPSPSPSPIPSPSPSPSPAPSPAPAPAQTGTDPAGLVPGLSGLTGSAGSSVAFAPLRAAVAGSQAGTLPFTGGAGDLLGVAAMALLAAGALLLRAGAARSHLRERR